MSRRAKVDLEQNLCDIIIYGDRTHLSFQVMDGEDADTLTRIRLRASLAVGIFWPYVWCCLRYDCLGWSCTESGVWILIWIVRYQPLSDMLCLYVVGLEASSGLVMRMCGLTALPIQSPFFSLPCRHRKQTMLKWKPRSRSEFRLKIIWLSLGEYGRWRTSEEVPWQCEPRVSIIPVPETCCFGTFLHGKFRYIHNSFKS